MVRSGDKWLAVYHGEVPIVDPKNPPKSRTRSSGQEGRTKKDDKAAQTQIPPRPSPVLTQALKP